MKKQLKYIRVDNGGEFMGLFEKDCRDYGIKLMKTVPKISQDNRGGERMNHTICERIQYILCHAKLPNFFGMKQ